jgi:hypothetical protein
MQEAQPQETTPIATTPTESETKTSAKFGRVESSIRAAAKALTGGSSIANKIKEASKAASSANAAKKRSAAPVGTREQATFQLSRPPRGKFVRVHPSEAYRCYNVPVLEHPDTNEMYFVDSCVDLPEFIAAQVRRINIYAAQTHDHSVFLWAVKVSETNWYKAARRAVTTAVNRWIQVQARKAANTYDLITPFDAIPEPDWSGFPPFDAMLEIAFDGHFIASTDHSLIKKLQGSNEDDDAGLI